jgi:hypothetical protein
MRAALLILIAIAAPVLASEGTEPVEANPLCAQGVQSGQFAQEDSRIRDLIDQLLDDDIGVREKAAAELADYGKAAVPALEKLRASQDVELRSRASSILRSITENEIVGRHWHRGPRITMDFEGAPVARVLEELARQAKDTFKFNAAALQEPVTVKVKDASFWDALEAVCRAAPALTWEGDGDALSFTPKRRPPYPAKRQGEFVVWLDAITYSRDYDFTGNPRVAFTLNLVSAWEAGIVPVAVEQQITEILDQDGASVMVPDRFQYYGGTRLEAPKGRTRRDGTFVPVPQAGKSAKKFSRVRGTSTFYFPRSYEDVTLDVRSTPNPAPLTLDRITIAVRNFRAMKDTCACELAMTVPVTFGDALIDRMPLSDIAVVDDQGGLHRGRSSGRNQMHNGTTYTLTDTLQVPFPEGRTAVGVKVRALKDAMEKRVQFEFNDIPVE